MMLRNKVILLLVISAFSGCFGATTTTTTTTMSPNQNELSDSELKEICQGIEYQFKAHPNNSKFVVCANGKGFEQQCPTGNCFDERNPPCSEECTDSELTIPDNVKEYCNKDNTELQLVANDKDCSSYFLCVTKGLDPISLKCPENQHFSDVNKKCMNFNEAQCLVPSKWCKERKDGKRFAAENCYEYYECRDENSLLKSCKYNEYYDANSEKCVTGICPTDNRIPNCKRIKDGKQFPHPKCNKYYICLNQSPLEVQCGNGFYYNAAYDKCVNDVNNVCN